MIAISFFAIWIYFLIWLWAGRREVQLSPAWQLLLAPSLILLAVVFVRRVKRVLSSLRGEDDQGRRSPGQSRPTNGHRKK